MRSGGKTIKSQEIPLLAVHEVGREKYRKVSGGGFEGEVDRTRDFPHRRLTFLLEIFQNREATPVCECFEGPLEFSYFCHKPYFTFYTIP